MRRYIDMQKYRILKDFFPYLFEENAQLPQILR